MKKVIVLLGFALAAFTCLPSFAAQNQDRDLKEREHKVQAAQEAPQCVICQDDLNNNTLVETLQCAHTFHTACLNGWRGQNTCPMCRTVINQNAPQQPAQQPQQLNNEDILADLIAIVQQPIVVNQQLQTAQQQNQQLQNQLNTRTRELRIARLKARQNFNRSQDLGLLLVASTEFTAGLTNYLPTTIAKIATGLAFSTGCGLFTAQHQSVSVDRTKELFRSSFLNAGAYTSAYALGACLRYLNPFGLLLSKLTWPSPK